MKTIKNDIKYDVLLMNALKLIELLLFSLLFINMWKQCYSAYLYVPYGIYSNTALFLLYCVVAYVLLRLYQAFDIGGSLRGTLFLGQCISLAVINGIFFVISLFVVRRNIQVMPFLGLFVCQIAVSLIWTVVVHKLYFAITKPLNACIVCKRKDEINKFTSTRLFDKRFKITRICLDPENYDAVRKDLENVSVVFITGVDSLVRNGILKMCIEKNIPCYVDPKIGDTLMGCSKPIYMFSVPVIYVARANLSPEYRIMKRVLDIVISLFTLLLVSPLMIIVALCIKLYDKGPVFYMQERLTKDGKVFNIIKFRSMIITAEKDGVARLASENDERITPIGKFIRACRIDELPQFINILKGEMSVVGPRPERPEIAEEYNKTNSSFDLRLQTKAGLTGYAQIYGRYNIDPLDKLKYDLIYVSNATTVEDIKIILATVKTLFQKEATQGVEANQITALFEEEKER